MFELQGSYEPDDPDIPVIDFENTISFKVGGNEYSYINDDISLPFGQLSLFSAS